MANRAPGPACKAFDQRGLARVHTTYRRPSLQQPRPGRACGFAGRGMFNFHMYDNLPICTLPKLLRQARRPALVLPSPGPRAHRSRPVEDAPSFPTCATVAPTSKVEGALMQPSLALVELGEVTARAKATDSLPADGLPALHNGLPGAPPRSRPPLPRVAQVRRAVPLVEGGQGLQRFVRGEAGSAARPSRVSSQPRRNFCPSASVLASPPGLRCPLHALSRQTTAWLSGARFPRTKARRSPRWRTCSSSQSSRWL